jgi:hypothetical protein
MCWCCCCLAPCTGVGGGGGQVRGKGTATKRTPGISASGGEVARRGHEVRGGGIALWRRASFIGHIQGHVLGKVCGLRVCSSAPGGSHYHHLSFECGGHAVRVSGVCLSGADRGGVVAGKC